jgi:hypothetical protein
MKNQRKNSRGLATMMVLVIIALASLIGMAMLASASLQESIASNTARGVAADYIAESAVQTASFYLQNPAKMPAAWKLQAGYALYVRGATISGVTGSFDADATLSSTVPDQYLIHAVGYSGGATNASRTETSTIQLVRAQPTYAAVFGAGTTTIQKGYTFNNAQVLTSGTISLQNGSTISMGIDSTPASSDFAVPTTGGINYYGGPLGTYTMSDGTIGHPLVVAGGTVTSLPNPDPLGINPGHVVYSLLPLTLTSSGAINFNGTLVVRGNAFTASPLGSASTQVQITPITGFPAVVTEQKLIIGGKNVGLKLNGAVWAGTGISWSGATTAGSTLIINGALLLPGGATLGSPVVSGSATINYTPVTVSNMTTAAQPIIGIKIASWTQ